MIIFKKVSDLQSFIAARKQEGAAVGFAPTMGALHDGHLSLLRRIGEDGMLKVCSIFLNPTQFNNKSDFEKYPVSTPEDVALLVAAGCDVLFLPPVAEIYPDGTEAGEVFDFGFLDTTLEGKHRPGHFKGVGQVVSRLLDIVQPDTLYMGQKDYQQCMVIDNLLKQKQVRTKLTICPTVREQDGLAMSSRNRRLTQEQRAVSGAIYQCLVSIQSKAFAQPFAIVKKECEALLADRGFEPEYVELADATTLSGLDDYESDRPMIALIAARIGEIRLIDNMYV